METPKAFILPLSDWQMEQVADLLLYNGELADAGKPGMVVAQVFMDHIAVGYLPHDIARQVQVIVNPKKAGQVTKGKLRVVHPAPPVEG